MIGRNFHEPSILETYQYCRFRVWQCCYLTLQVAYIKFISYRVIVQVRTRIELYQNTYLNNHDLLYNNLHWIWTPKDDSHLLVGNIPCMHRSKCKVSRNNSTARFSTMPNEARTRTSPMQMNKVTILSRFTTSWFAVRKCSFLIDKTDSSNSWDRESLFITFGTAPESSELATVYIAFNVPPIRTCTQ